jgi:hypothetical protein
LKQGRVELDVEAADQDELAALDLLALERAATAFVRSIRRRSHRGSLSLERAFEKTIAAWRAKHPEDIELDELFTRFVESNAFERFREDGSEALGASIEEAFFRFATLEQIGTRATRETEFFVAFLVALAVVDAPRFMVPPELARCPRGHRAVAQTTEGHFLFAALDGRYVEGPVTADIARILDAGGSTDPRDEKTCTALAAMGLL